MNTYTHGHHESVLRSHRMRRQRTPPHTSSRTCARPTRCSISAPARAPSPPTWPAWSAGSPPRRSGRRNWICRARHSQPGTSPMPTSACRTRTTSPSPKPPSTSSTPTRYSSTWPTRCRRCARWPGSRARAVSSQRATAITRPSPGGRSFPDSIEWLRLYRAAARANGGEPDAGRRLLSWARAAGLTDITATSSTWCFATPADRDHWGRMWADRITESALARQLVDGGYAAPGDLRRISAAWLSWAAARTAGSQSSTARSSAGPRPPDSGQPPAQAVPGPAAWSRQLPRSRLPDRLRPSTTRSTAKADPADPNGTARGQAHRNLAAPSWRGCWPWTEPSR